MDLLNTNDTNGTTNYDGYLPFPDSIMPMSTTITYAAITVSACGLASVVASFSVFSSLMYRLCTWSARTISALHRSQFVILFLNLVFADLCQGTAFSISWYWYAIDAILAPSAACSTQGFLINFGDVASAFFSLYIAIHTYLTACRRVRVPYKIFYLVISIIWLLALMFTVIGFAMHPKTYFVRVAGWCWISHDYEPHRLGLHYFWVFLSEFGLLIAYLIILILLRRETAKTYSEQRRASSDLANKDAVNTIKRVTMLMMLYPLAYIVLTLPISVCRMWSMAHGGQPVPETLQIVVGGLLASCGWVNCLLYTLTRKRLLKETMSRGSGNSMGSDPHSNEQDFKMVPAHNEIVQTTSFAVRSDSFEGVMLPPPDTYSDVAGSNLGSRGRATEPEEGDLPQDRSPSPFSLPEPAFPCQQPKLAHSLRHKKAFDLLPFSRSKQEV
ncbi:hypothetical protein Q7P37_006628 [Cladosporium fusiforme]